MLRVMAISLLLGASAIAATINVPADYLTIQEGIGAATDGDTVLVAAGEYDEGSSLEFLGKQLVVLSASGAANTKILSEVSFGAADTLGPVLEGFEVKRIVAGDLADPTVLDCRIHNPEHDYDAYGGGSYIQNASVSFEGCVFLDNWSWENGGGAFVTGANSRVVFNSCSFTGNYGRMQGAALAVEGSAVVELHDCTFEDQVMSENGGFDIDCRACDSIVVERCSFFPRSEWSGFAAMVLAPRMYALVSGCTMAGTGENFMTAFQVVARAPEAKVDIEKSIVYHTDNIFYSVDPDLQLTVDCCLFFDYNSLVRIGGATITGYVNADPLFCDPDNGNYMVSDLSPCAAAYSPCGEQIGRYGTDCTTEYVCGDANDDELANITDAVHLIDYIFTAGAPMPSPPIAGDCNCDLIVNITDAVYLIEYIFDEGPAPCADCL